MNLPLRGREVGRLSKIYDVRFRLSHGRECWQLSIRPSCASTLLMGASAAGVPPISSPFSQDALLVVSCYHDAAVTVKI